MNEKMQLFTLTATLCVTLVSCFWYMFWKER
uniref:Lipoprotein n=1 Tax=Siphoviridae sp. ctTnV63 TaxID=2825523 RepID=A0A8S5NV18_9CAUD|nr:MAG TPA: hypothetical protein [Siphoviridae sp. ctTnV63]